MSTDATPLISIGHRIPTAIDPIKSSLNELAAEMRVAIPAIVQSFDPVKQTVTVVSAVTERFSLNGVVSNYALPRLDYVPVSFPRAGGFSLTFPIVAGDECLLVFTDVAYDLWWQNGGVCNQPEGMTFRHEVGNAIAIFGLWNQKRLLPAYSTASTQLRSDDGTVVIDLATDGVTVKAPAVAMISPAVTAQASGGTAAPVVTQAFLTWFTASVMPFLISKGYTGPAPPAGSLTNVFEAQ